MRTFYSHNCGFDFVMTHVSGGPSLVCKALQNILDDPSPEAVSGRAGAEYVLN